MVGDGRRVRVAYWCAFRQLSTEVVGTTVAEFSELFVEVCVRREPTFKSNVGDGAPSVVQKSADFCNAELVYECGEGSARSAFEESAKCFRTQSRRFGDIIETQFSAKILVYDLHRTFQSIDL